MKLTPISRTIGTDRIVDELIVSFTHTTYTCSQLAHDRNIDWMVPGIPPTGRKVVIPLVAIVCIRGGKLFHEHIYWSVYLDGANDRDQASVLMQLGLLNAGTLPIAGVETALKVMDEKSVKSNKLIKTWKE
jgi:carboxymethylenebutenolidase